MNFENIIANEINGLLTGVLVGIVLTAFFWILRAINSGMKAKDKKKQQDETVEKIYHILGAAANNAELHDEEETMQFVKAVEDLINKNMQVLDTEFMCLLEKHLKVLKDYIKALKKPTEAIAVRPTQSVPTPTPPPPPPPPIQTTPAAQEFFIEKKAEMTLEIEPLNMQTAPLAEVKAAPKMQETPVRDIPVMQDIPLDIPAESLQEQTDALPKQAVRPEIIIDTDIKPSFNSARKLSDGIFPTPEIKLPEKPSEEHVSEKTSYMLNATQEIQMGDIIREHSKK